MRGLERLIATGIIWAAVAGIAISMGSNIETAFLCVLAAAGFLSTAVVWRTSLDLAEQANKQRIQKLAQQTSEKPKRLEQPSTNWLDSLSIEQLSALENAITVRRNSMDEDEQIELNRLLAEKQAVSHSD